MASEMLHAATGTDELLQSVLSSVRDAMCVLSRDGRILSSNDAWEELGLEVSTEAPFDSICDALIGDSSGATTRGVAAVLDGAQDVYTHEFPRSAPAHEGWFRVTVSPLRRRDGGAVMVLTDLTEHKKAQEALQQDGSGFDVARASNNGRLGLVSMEERVRFVGGELEVRSEPSLGTRLHVRIPLGPKAS